MPDRDDSAARRRITDVDAVFGARLRQYRIRHGLTQHELAEKAGVTYQQIHKYERGINRISAARLYRLMGLLDISPVEMFADIEPLIPTAHEDRALLSLMRDVADLSPEHRRAVAAVVRALRGGGSEEDDR